MELEELKRLAGIYERHGWKQYDGPNLSITGTEKQYYQAKLDIQPGTPEWFKLWFARPKLTGENPLG
jgi:hypothetical protein